MKTRWRIANYRHQYFEIQDADGMWRRVGRIDSFEGAFTCAIVTPRLRVIGSRVRESAAKQFTEATALRLLREQSRWWFERLIEKKTRRAGSVRVR